MSHPSEEGTDIVQEKITKGYAKGHGGRGVAPEYRRSDGTRSHHVLDSYRTLS